MLTWDWEAVATEALRGDNDALALLDNESRDVLCRARDLYRDGHTPDEDIAALIATVEHCRPVRLH